MTSQDEETCNHQTSTGWLGRPRLVCDRHNLRTPFLVFRSKCLNTSGLVPTESPAPTTDGLPFRPHSQRTITVASRALGNRVRSSA